MKTQNNNQETSKSQVRKSTLGASAVLFGAILISLSVNAQDLWKEFSNSASYGKMALVMDGQLNETENADAVFEAINAEVAKQLYHANEMFITETEAEETMKVESWMVDDANFTPTVDFNAVETEESMEVESWMTVEEFFNSTEVRESAEPALEVESWMTKAEYFYSPEVLVYEEELAIESWMLEAKNFSNQHSHEKYAVK